MGKSKYTFVQYMDAIDTFGRIPSEFREYADILQYFKENPDDLRTEIEGVLGPQEDDDMARVIRLLDRQLQMYNEHKEKYPLLD